MLTTALTIREMRHDDLRTVYAIHCEGNADVAETEPLLPFHGPSGWATFSDEVRGELDDEEHRHVVVERTGECVGWAHAHLAMTPDGAAFGYVSAVYVARAARRQGAGSMLLDELVRWLREKEVDRIELVTPSRGPARSLWVKRGFRPLTETLVYEAKPR